MRINGSQPGELNFGIPYSTGLLRPPHVKRFGLTSSLFMAFEDKVTGGEGTDGIVLAGKIVTDASLADQLEVHVKSIATCRRRLEQWRYIQTEQRGKGYVVRVRKSKKWLLLQSLRGNESAPSEPDEGVRSLHQRERSHSIRGSDPAPSEGSLPLNDIAVTKQGLSLVAEELVRFWNENRGGLPEIQTFTKTRKEKLTTRLRENPNFISNLKEALAKANASSFIQSGSWKPSIDWFLKNDGNLVKVLEGQYDDKGGTRGTSNPRGSNSGAGKRPGPFIPAALRKPIPATPNALRRPTAG